MDVATRTFLKELLVPALPGFTELYAFRGKRALLDCAVYSLVSVVDQKRAQASIKQPLHQAWTFVSGLSAGMLTGWISIDMSTAVTHYASLDRYDDAALIGAFCIAGRGAIGCGARTLEHYVRKSMG